MASQTNTTGGAVLGFLLDLTKAVATGLSSSKDVDEGCGSCPDDDGGGAISTSARRRPRIRYGRRRRRRK